KEKQALSNGRVSALRETEMLNTAGNVSVEEISPSSSRSLHALDWLNFFMADVVTGVGPFLAIYLTATRHWDPASVGLVVAIQSVASVVAQGPCGWLVDWSEHKKWLIACAAIIVAAGCFGIVQVSNLRGEIAAQTFIGIASAIFPPAIAALSLG